MDNIVSMQYSNSFSHFFCHLLEVISLSEDITQFFDIVRVGSPGEFVYEPVKIGVLYGKVYVEVHEDIYKLVPDLWDEAQRVVRESGWEDMVDQILLTKALMEKSGVPTDVTKGSKAASFGETAAADPE